MTTKGMRTHHKRDNAVERLTIGDLAGFLVMLIILVVVLVVAFS